MHLLVTLMECVIYDRCQYVYIYISGGHSFSGNFTSVDKDVVFSAGAGGKTRKESCKSIDRRTVKQNEHSDRQSSGKMSRTMLVEPVLHSWEHRYRRPHCPLSALQSSRESLRNLTPLSPPQRTIIPVCLLF